MAADAAYADLHKDRPWHDGTYTRWAKERSASFPYRYDFGVNIGVSDSDVRPDDLFTTREEAPLVAATAAAAGELAVPDDGGDERDDHDPDAGAGSFRE